MKLIPCGHKLFDRNDPGNAGIISDEQVGPGSGGAMLRRVVYHCPDKGTIDTYITTEMILPPGIIARLYKQQWDIEKTTINIRTK